MPKKQPTGNPLVDGDLQGITAEIRAAPDPAAEALRMIRLIARFDLRSPATRIRRVELVLDALDQVAGPEEGGPTHA